MFSERLETVCAVFKPRDNNLDPWRSRRGPNLTRTKVAAAQGADRRINMVIHLYEETCHLKLHSERQCDYLFKDKFAMTAEMQTKNTS